MNENYTAEDFARATLATKGEHGVARRTYPRGPHQWHVYGAGYGWFSDEEMAADGWTPVVEATEVMQNRQIDAEAHLEQIERLSKRVAAAGDRIDRQLLALDDLREENYRLERILQTPLSLKDLQVAWEEAEVPTDGAPIRAGDVVIEKITVGAYAVMSPPPTCGLVGREFRVLSRAPKREPHENLADAIREVWPSAYAEIDIGSLAYALHERGVGISKSGRE